MQFKSEKNQITRLDKELLTTDNGNSVVFIVIRPQTVLFH